MKHLRSTIFESDLWSCQNRPASFRVAMTFRLIYSNSNNVEIWKHQYKLNIICKFDSIFFINFTFYDFRHQYRHHLNNENALPDHPIRHHTSNKIHVHTICVRISEIKFNLGIFTIWSQLTITKWKINNNNKNRSPCNSSHHFSQCVQNIGDSSWHSI